MLEDRLKIKGRLLSSRLVAASGCRVTSLETLLKYSKWQNGFGMFTIKSIGPGPKPGNPAPIYCADPDFGQRARRNAVGLANPGHAYFARELRELREHCPDMNGALILGSAFGANLDEISRVCVAIAPYVDAIEINFSCPHAKGYGFDTGTDAEAIAAIVRAVSTVTGLDVFPKLSPNLPDDELAEIAKACISAGARGITVINTVEPRHTYLPGTDSPILFNGMGGASGPHIKERGLKCVANIREAIGPEPLIIGMGGVYTGVDAREYLEAGSDFVGIGTAMEFMSSELLRQYLFRMNFDIDNNADTAERLLPACGKLHYESARIAQIDDLSDELRVLTFAKGVIASPAQYFFLAVPGDDDHPTMEAPFSIPTNSPLTLAVRIYNAKGREHHFTSRVKQLRQGQDVFIRGPYGVPFNMPKHDDIVLVGGGTGTAALASIARQYPHHTAFIGARDVEEVLFHDAFMEPHVSIGYIGPDGQVGRLVTQSFGEYPLRPRDKEGHLVTCGPTPMMQKVVEIAINKGMSPENVYAIMEPYMKCGVGICGSCSDYQGNIACTDGHIMDANRFLEVIDLGKVKRDATGAWER